MAVLGQRVNYVSDQLAADTAVVIRCTATVKGTGTEARVATDTVVADETFNVIAILSGVTALCPGAEQEFTARVAPGTNVTSCLLYTSPSPRDS